MYTKREADQVPRAPSSVADTIAKNNQREFGGLFVRVCVEDAVVENGEGGY